MENKESVTKCGSTAKKDEVIVTGEESPMKQDNIFDSSIGYKKGKKNPLFIFFLRLKF